MKYKLGFLGTGVMAGAILNRILMSASELKLLPSEILIFDTATEKTIVFEKQGVAVASSANMLFAECERVLIGVKPQVYADVLKKIELINAKTIISIMAGVKISTLKVYLPEKTTIIRVMPNTPCFIGKGMMGITFDGATDNEKDFIISLFSACGDVLELAESKFDALTSISGSGPAYVYMFANAMIKAGIAGGLSEEEARTLTFATLEGSSSYARVAPYDLDTMVDRVCSPGGTTIEAVTIYKNNNLEGIIVDGIDACREKSKLLSDKL